MVTGRWARRSVPIPPSSLTWSWFPSGNISLAVTINQSFASFPGLRIPYFHGMNTQGMDSGVIEQAILFSTPKSNNYEKQKGARRCKKHEGYPEKSQLQKNRRSHRKENGRNKTCQRFRPGGKYAFSAFSVLLLKIYFRFTCFSVHLSPGSSCFRISPPGYSVISWTCVDV